MATSTGSTGSTDAGDGITGGYTGDSVALRIVIGSFIAISWYNAVELNILIFATFQKYWGLYFWSLVVASWGVVFYGIGFLFKFFQVIDNGVGNVVFITLGWWCMVTGQSVVLYSRLHLILLNEKLLRRILWMIIIDAVILHIPTTVLTFGSNGPVDTAAFVRGYNVMEKIQMTGFCIQEFIISGIYLWETAKFLRTDDQAKSRKTLYQLFYINIIIILMDLSLLGLEYANLYILEIVIKGMVYSVKLKLEFAILGKLVQYVRNPSGQVVVGRGSDVSEFLHPFDTAAADIPEASVTTPSRPAAPPKEQSRENLDELSASTYEHIENQRNDDASVSAPDQSAIQTTDRRRSEDEIEMMMKRYSVGYNTSENETRR